MPRCILRSADEGATWQSWQPVAESILEPFTYGQIVELGDGTLLCPIWGRWRSEERWRSGALFSRDGGLSWGEPVSIAYDPSARLVTGYAQSAINGFDAQGNVDMGAISSPTFRPHSSIDGFTETSVIALADGRLLAILRQQGVEGDQTLFFYRALSNDGGRSWSPYQRTSLRGISPCLHHAPDGRLLLAYRRYAPDGDPASAPGLSIATSDDDGAVVGDQHHARGAERARSTPANIRSATRRWRTCRTGAYSRCTTAMTRRCPGGGIWRPIFSASAFLSFSSRDYAVVSQNQF